MFKVCISYSKLTTKTKGMCEGTSKQSTNPKDSTALGLRPPVFEIPGSATERLCVVRLLLAYHYLWLEMVRGSQTHTKTFCRHSFSSLSSTYHHWGLMHGFP